MKKYFIVNPVSGSGNTKKYIPLLKKYECDEIYVTSKKGDARRFIRNMSSEGEECVFYAVGGDGTLNEAVNGAAGRDNVSIGIIPAGTGNDFVRIFSETDKFCDIDAQLGGKTIKVDTVRVVLDEKRTTRFINMANVGFDCNVVINASRIKKGKVSGSAAYMLGAAQEFFGKWGQDVRIRFDSGETYCGCQLLCTIANGRFCGGGFNSSPRADISDGLLDVAVIDKIGRMKLISLLKKYRDGTYLDAPEAGGFITYRRTGKMTVCFSQKTPMSVDGEIYGFKKAEFAVENKNVNFIVPDGAEIAGGRI